MPGKRGAYTDQPPRTKLGALRHESGLAQAEIAEAIGVSLPTYQRLERGNMENPPLRYLQNLALLYGVRLEAVLEDGWREWFRARPVSIRELKKRSLDA